jgi:hypothetical protein
MSRSYTPPPLAPAWRVAGQLNFYFISTSFGATRGRRVVVLRHSSNSFGSIPVFVSVAIRHHLAVWSCCCPPATWSRFAALVVAIVGNISSWISGNFYVWLNYYVPYRKTHWFIPNKTKKTLLHGQYPELKFILWTGHLQGPKFCTCYSGYCLGPKCRFSAGNKTISTKTCTSSPTFQIIPKSYDLVLIFPCLLPTFLGRMFLRDYGDSLYGSCPSEVPFQESSSRLTSARLLGDSIPLEEQSETEFHTRNR